ncbi:MAG: thioredoxin domain-containing protein [Calditrichaeota bacterium]|nr:MAG: thioredoxin domain-containing protein [Calditrichota bacterium]
MLLIDLPVIPVHSAFAIVTLIFFTILVGCATQNQDSQSKASNRISEFVAKQRAAGKTPNRLINENSPYLLQHAFNPVDWYPWGEEAFQAARETGHPIFLSIGYATCHWCHVMEHESFEDEQIAAYLNSHFIPIKVDREERPDVDAVYMAATQAMTGRGGWPMSVFLTADLKPFYCGTYFPPKSKYGQPGFGELLQGIIRVWQEDQEKILQSADQLTQALKQHEPISESHALDEALLTMGFRQFQQAFDATHGGFGPAPKFPRPSIYNFLFRYAESNRDEQARQMAMVTLRKMAEGGLHDHLGGGFHRYAVDEQWRVSHFEKMLYDQAQLAVSYLEAHQISGAAFFAQVVRGIFGYVLRDMTDAAGGFYSAEDADSPIPENPGENAEGAFYLWDKKEIENLLTKEEADLFCTLYGITENGNTIADPHGEFGTKNVPYLAQKQPTDKIQRTRLQDIKSRLLDARAKRPRPLLDDKIITSWNGLMISAFAKGYQVLRDKQYLKAAQNAVGYLKKYHIQNDGVTLFRRSRAGAAGLTAHLDDYAFFVQGLIDLYEASFEIDWLKLAVALTEKQIALFADENGGFFDTSGQDKNILLQMKNSYDGAEPSGNSIAILNLLRLAGMTGREDWRLLAEKALKSMQSRIEQSPSAFPQLMVAINNTLQKPTQIVLAAASKEAPIFEKMHGLIGKTFIGNRVLLFADGKDGQNFLGENLEFIRAVQPVDGKPTAFVCENFVCKEPAHEIAVLEKQLADR